MNKDELYMNRCLMLASYGRGKVSPNPMVGAVVVVDDRIVGEGYHRCCGEAHAEVNAINAVLDKALLKRATLYVNLEPCSHYGKTPPCADLIVKSAIPRVVIGMLDPNPMVNGRGVKILQQAGVETTVGVLEANARLLNRRFVAFVEQQRPYVILKWAETADGCIDAFRSDATTPPLEISNSTTKTLNHQIRTHEDAIMVGTNTALLDNPHLTARKWSGKNPIRIVLDRTLRLPSSYRLFNKAAKTIVFNSVKDETQDNIFFCKIDFAKKVVPQVLDILYQLSIKSLIVEGGNMLLSEFISLGLWDECCIETSARNLVKGAGVVAPTLTNFRVVEESKIGDNKVVVCNRLN